MAAEIRRLLRACLTEFENKSITVVASKNAPETKLLGLTVGPYEEGKEYQERFWIARALVEEGIARFRPDGLMDFSRLEKIHWTEMIQSSRGFSSLPGGFYQTLRFYMSDLKADLKERGGDPDYAERYAKSKRYVEDIINYRLKKLVVLASYPTVTGSALQTLTDEEKILHEKLRNLISEWRSCLLEKEGGAPDHA